MLSVPKKNKSHVNTNYGFYNGQGGFQHLYESEVCKQNCFVGTGSTFTGPTGCRYGYLLSGSMAGGARPGNGANRNNRYNNTSVLHGQGALLALPYAKTSESAQDGGPRTLRKVQI